VITPRRTRLVRVPDLRSFRKSIAALLRPPDGERLIVVPSRGSARQLARTLAELGAAIGPDECVTRDQMYDAFHVRLPAAPPRLSAFDRAAMMQDAAMAAADDVRDLPFRVRPGLVAELLRFYDQLRRQSQQVSRFEALIEQALGGAVDDRGGARLLRQTRFLARTFLGYEARVRRSGGWDEHILRDQLVSQESPAPLRHVIVTIPDWIADPAGLFVADFDLLARIPGLQTIDIVATRRILASGFHERLHNWWPGIEESADAGGGTIRPRLLIPGEAPPAAGAAGSQQLWFTARDREEELVRIARRVVHEMRTAETLFGPPAPERIAVVFKRPLPYLYLAPESLGAAGLAFQSGDALPLAAQPFAAAVDVALDLVEGGFAREAIVALLQLPQFDFHASVERASIAALDRDLSEQRYLGDLSRLERIQPRYPQAGAALSAALLACRELAPLQDPAPASTQLRRLRAFLLEHAVAGDAPAGRDAAARHSILTLLGGIASAHEAHHDADWGIDDLASAVRRWIEEETCPPDGRAEGIQLLDDQAARFGTFDDLAIVGMVEQEWPEKPRRNIFYPAELLKALGWPTEKDRRGADDARFVDLLESAERTVAVSTFTLEEDTLTTRSMQLDEIPAAKLSTFADPTDTELAVLREEMLARDAPDLDALEPTAREWAAMRLARPEASRPEFHGQTGPPPERTWSVSALETYLGCPFRFFAQHVLRLEEEPEDEEVMDPRRQGQFVHGVFEEFFRRWDASGRAGITPANIDAARELFAETVDRQLAPFSAAEAGLERTRLLGSSAAAGLGDAVFRMEAERPVRVVERQLERSFTAPLTIVVASGSRTVQVKGKADRLDLLEDGSFRLIDYKLGWPPNRARALQLPIYSLCAEAELTGYRGRRWVLGEAAYLAFKGPKRVIPLFSSAQDRTKVLGDAQQRLADTLDAIGRGEFPPSPDDVYRCETCAFSTVCRKDYVGDV
jgi:RecB family exonuclease